MHGILKLRNAILAEPDLGWRTRYGGKGTEEVLRTAELEPGAVNSENVALVAGRGGGNA
jgi:NADH-quinone oxidoreductase subunit B